MDFKVCLLKAFLQKSWILAKIKKFFLDDNSDHELKILAKLQSSPIGKVLDSYSKQWNVRFLRSV